MRIGRKKLSKLVILNLIAVLVIASALAAEFPVPHSINGFIYSSETGEMVSKGTPFSINNTNNGFFVQGTTGRKPHPSGRYSAAINGNDGDIILVKAWSGLYSSEITVILNGAMSNVNLYLKTEISNVPPVITSIPITNAIQDQLYVYDVEAYDENGDSLSYGLNNAPNGMSINSTSGLITWIPSSAQVGNHSVEISVSDGKNVTIQSYTLFVENANDAPIITSNPILGAAVNSEYSYEIEAYDIDGDTLTYSLLIAPEGMIINETNGIIKWIPNEAQIGSHNVSVIVSDGSLFAQQNFTITVSTTQNNPPIITSSPVKTATEGVQYIYDVDAIDYDNDKLSYVLLTYPAGMIIDNVTGLITWTPNATQVDSYDITVIVYDSKGASALQWYVLTVANVNNAPIIISKPITTAETGELYRYDVDAIDFDNDVLTYSLIQAPRGMNIDSNSGLITWKPKLRDIGENRVVVNVSDGITYSTQSFTINVVRSRTLRWYRIIVSIIGHNAANLDVNNSDSGYNYETIVTSENNLVLVNGMDGDLVKIKAQDSISYGETEFEIEEDMPTVALYLNKTKEIISENQNITNLSLEKPITNASLNKSVLSKTIRLQFKTAITEVHYTVTGSSDASLEVEQVNRSYAPIEKAASVYQYVNMRLKNIENRDVDGFATVIFKVDKDWLKEQGIIPEKINLYRFSNGWSNLNTTLVFDDSDYYYYKSDTPGFSLFAIAGEKSQEEKIIENKGAILKAPKGISGYIFQSDGKTQIESGTLFRITNLRTNKTIADKTGVASLGGRYSVLLDGEDGDELLIQVGEKKPYLQGRVILQGDRDNVNFVVNEKEKSLVLITGAQTLEADYKTSLRVNVIIFLIVLFILIVIAFWPLKRKPKEPPKIDVKAKLEEKKPEQIKQKPVIDPIRKISESQYFYLSDGRVLKNLDELAEALNKMSDDTFNRHVTDSKNDFSNWINDVWEEKILASSLRNVKDKTIMRQILLKYLGK